MKVDLRKPRISLEPGFVLSVVKFFMPSVELGNVAPKVCLKSKLSFKCLLEILYERDSFNGSTIRCKRRYLSFSSGSNSGRRSGNSKFRI